MQEIYLDNNATTKPFPEVVEATALAMSDLYGNPSSPHRRGDTARKVLLEARQSVSEMVGCPEDGIIFTSGGTEANNLVLLSLCKPKPDARLITSAVEHSSILQVANMFEGMGIEVVILDVDAQGKIDPVCLAEALEEPATLVSIQWANSETGTLQKVETLGEICQNHNVPFHVDAAQSVGRMPIDMRQLPVTFMTFTAHKIHGPQGVGAVATVDRTKIMPMLQGGDQEGGYRPGTENLPGIAGFGKAAHLRKQSLAKIIEELRRMRNCFEDAVLEAVPKVKINGSLEFRTPNSTNILFPGVDGMAMLAQLDRAGIRCSLTSACVSSRPVPSHVLIAIGLSEEEAYSSIRFSFSILNSEDEAYYAANKACEIYQSLTGLERTASMRT